MSTDRPVIRELARKLAERDAFLQDFIADIDHINSLDFMLFEKRINALAERARKMLKEEQK